MVPQVTKVTKVSWIYLCNIKRNWKRHVMIRNCYSIIKRKIFRVWRFDISVYTFRLKNRYVFNFFAYNWYTVLELMLHNTYGNEAKENILSHCQSRMSRWMDRNTNEMTFLSVLPLTEIFNFPTLEFQWKTDSLYYRSFIHNIEMAYNKFSIS